MKKHKRKLKPWFISIIAVVAAAAVFGTGALLWNLFSGGGVSRGKADEPVFPKSVYGTPVHTVLMPETIEARTGIKRKIKYIVIHETGNTAAGADAKSHSDYLTDGKSGETSWHYTVDDAEIYHHIPDDEIAWHAGDTKNPKGGNALGVGIEFCVNSDGDFEKTLDNGARLTAYLLKAYGLGITAVTQHGDYMEKNCPETLRDSGRWTEFLQMVKNYYDAHAGD